MPLEPHTFVSCGEDGTVRCYDLRVKQSCNCRGYHPDGIRDVSSVSFFLTISGVSYYCHAYLARCDHSDSKVHHVNVHQPTLSI